MSGPETVTGWTVPGDQPITVTLEPVQWLMFDADDNYVGMLGKFDGPLGRIEEVKPVSFSARGYGQDLDGHRVQVEADFDTREEAVQWLLDGYLTRAES